MRNTWPALALLMIPLPAAAASGPSFSCAAVGTSVELAICGDPTLARLDADLARRFVATLAADPAGKPMLLDAQRIWLASRTRECRPADPTKPADASCLEKYYASRIADLALHDPRDTPLCQALASRIRERGGLEVGLAKDLPRLLADDPGAPIRFDLEGEDLTQALRAKLPKLDDSEIMNASVLHFGGNKAFFAVDSVQGTANCQFVSLFKIVSGGAMQSLAPPTGTQPGCPEDTYFASTAGTAPVPLYVESSENLSKASMRLWSRRDDAWHPMCAIEVRYETRLALSQRSCAVGVDCQALAAAATTLAEARARVEGEAPKRLGAAERMAIEDDKTQEDVPSFGDIAAKGGIGEFEYSAPVYSQPGPHGRIALRISHDTLGWRTFENWLVGIYDAGKEMTPLAGFEFTTSRTALRDVSIR